MDTIRTRSKSAAHGASANTESVAESIIKFAFGKAISTTTKDPAIVHRTVQSMPTTSEYLPEKKVHVVHVKNAGENYAARVAKLLGTRTKMEYNPSTRSASFRMPADDVKRVENGGIYKLPNKNVLSLLFLVCVFLCLFFVGWFLQDFTVQPWRTE